MIKKYLMYLLRWQLSTPILAIVLVLLANMNEWIATIIANLLGGLIFFWVDKIIFSKKRIRPIWEIKKNIICSECGIKTEAGFRIVEWNKYDRSNDKNPQFRCIDCSNKKYEEVKKLI